MINIALITAMTKARVIGKGNKLPWSIPEELQYFKQITLHKPIIMGNSTFESIGKRPLPNRFNIILTRDQQRSTEYNRQYDSNNLVAVTNIADSIQEAKNYYNKQPIKSAGVEDPNREIMVIGGANIYRQFLPMANKLYLSVIKDNYPGDVLFPDYDHNNWRLQQEQPHARFIAQVWVNSEAPLDLAI